MHVQAAQCNLISLILRRKGGQIIEKKRVAIIRWQPFLRSKETARLPAKVVEGNIFLRHTQHVQGLDNRSVHHWRAAEIVFHLFWFWMVFQVFFIKISKILLFSRTCL